MNIGVIFAGGVGARMHSKDKPKQFLEIHGKPIIIHTLEYFEDNPEIDAIVIACLGDWIPYMEMLIKKYHVSKVKKIVPGGSTGQLSIYHGLLAAKEVSGDEKTVVLIHDGVRPLITKELLTQNIHSVKEYGNAVTCSQIKETMVFANKGVIENVLPRANSYIAKAPQSFWLSDILNAQEQAVKEGKTDYIDSCTLMQHYGYKMHIVIGSSDNIKITTPNDYFTMREILNLRENDQIYNPSGVQE